MPSSLTNQPKVLRGAFVELSSSDERLTVVFQFNPMMINRTRSITVTHADTPGGARAAQNQRLLKQTSSKSLSNARGGQTLKVNPVTLNFDIRLDATDKLNEGDETAQKYGIGPQLASLEMMMLPKNQRPSSNRNRQQTGNSSQSFAFRDDEKNPPIILFIWGRKKVMPVNITNMQIKEEEFSTELYPTRATITVSLEIIEGPGATPLLARALREVKSHLNLAESGYVSKVNVPVW